MGLVAVRDPNVLSQLDGAPAVLKPVTDERVLFELENGTQKPSVTDQVVRQVGLTGRAALQGLYQLPGMIANAGLALNERLPQTVIANAAKRAIGLNTSPVQFADQSQLGNFISDGIGLPKPENAIERVSQDVAAAMAGQGGLMKIGDLLSRSAGPVISRIGDLLRIKPASQIVSAAGGAGGSSVAREEGAGPVGQTVAGMAGGVVAPVAADAAVTGVRAAARGVRAAIDPFTQAGRQRVVGDTLRRLATSPDDAVAAMADAPETVPGSRPTAAQAARDEGLLIAERGVASSNPQAGARLTRRGAEQNQARNILLRDMAGDDKTVLAATEARDTATGQLRRDAFAAKQQVNIAPVIEKIDQVIGSPAGKRQTVSDAMTWLKGRLAGITDPEELYAIRQDIGDVLSGKLQGEKANLRLASSQLIEARKVLDDVIEAGAPGFKKYLSSYAEQSRPIDRMTALQDVQERVLNAGTDAATGERIMSQAKFYNVVTRNRAELEKVLTKEQMANLEAIGRDLDSSALSSSSGKAAGSNTTQNLSTAYVIGAALGNKAQTNGVIQNLARPLQWLNKLNEPQIQELLVDAMLDPGLARSLMMKATPRIMESIGLELKQRLAMKGFGGATGTATATRPRSEE